MEAHQRAVAVTWEAYGYRLGMSPLEVLGSKVNGSMGGYNLLINGGIPWGEITH